MKNEPTIQQYIITENIEDHEGYKGQKVFIKELLEDGYFRVGDCNEYPTWCCTMDELTEVIN